MKSLPSLLGVLLFCGQALASAEPVASIVSANAPYAAVGSIERLTPELDAVLAPEARVEVLAEGFRWVLTRPETGFIVGTETGIIHRLQQENPGKAFYPLNERAVCQNMKKTTLEKVLWCLRDNETIVKVEEPVAAQARKAIEAMLALS